MNSETLNRMTPDELDGLGRIYANRQAIRESAETASILTNAGYGREAAHSLADVANRETAAVGRLGLPEAAAITTAITNVTAVADQASHDIQQRMRDDTIPADARRRLADEQLTTARERIAAEIERAEANAQVAEAHLTMAAIGKPTAAREAFARADAEVTLAAANTIHDGLNRLASDPDPDVRALAAGDWGIRRLQTSGINGRDLQATLKGVRAHAVEATRKHGTGPRKDAADKLAQLPAAAKLIAVGTARARLTLQAFDRGTAGR